MKKNFLLIASLILVLAVALCGCAGDKQGEASTITIGIAQDIKDSLDPHIGGSAGTREIMFNVFEGLVKPNSNGELLPALAESVDVDSEGKVYTFKLRENVKFHDGTDMDAGDVIASINKCAGTDGTSPIVAAFSNIEKVESQDGKSIVITLKESDTDFLPNMTCAILPSEKLDASITPVGTGPYMYVSRSPQEKIVLKRFDNYWGEKAYIENAIFKIVPNADTLVMNLEGGSIDLSAKMLTFSQAEELSDKFQVLEGTSNLVQALYLNNAEAPFDNPKVRQALSYAINRQELLDYLSGGKGTVIGSSMFPAFEKYYVPELSEYYNHNVETAKQLLKEAGFEQGFDLEITVPSNYELHVQTAQIIQNQLKEVGVNATLKMVEWNTWLSDVYSGRQYQATVVGLDASTLSARALLGRFQTGAKNNFVNFSSEEFDKTYEAALKSTDDAEQTRLYKECEEILTREAANVYLQDLPEFVALNKRYTGYEFYPLYAMDLSKIKPAD